MTSATVTTNGRVTIPKSVRDDMGLTPGGKVEFEILESGEVVMRAWPGPGPSYFLRAR